MLIVPFLVPVTNTPHHFSLWPSSTWSNFMCASFKASQTLVWIPKYDESEQEIDLQHKCSLHSKKSLWILQMAASHSFLGWGTSISPHETGRYPTVLLSCDVETLYNTADTRSLWADLIRNMQWGAWCCDGLHCKDRGRMCPVSCLHCQGFSPGQDAKGFGCYCFSFPQHFLWLHNVIFGRLVAAKGFQKKINVLLQQVCWFWGNSLVNPVTYES